MAIWVSLLREAVWKLENNLVGISHAFHGELSPTRITSINFSYKKYAEESVKELLNQVDHFGKERKKKKIIKPISVWLEIKESTM